MMQPQELQDPLFRALMLLAMIWLGFSLTFVTLLVLSTYSSKRDSQSNILASSQGKAPISLSVRLILGGLLLLGTFGAVAIWGLARRFQIDGASIVFLLGVGIGVWSSMKFRSGNDKESDLN